MKDVLSLVKLRQNPFSAVPVGDRVEVWAGYDAVKKELLDIVESCRSDRIGLTEFAVIHGEIGTGKTHALRYLAYWISEAKREDFRSRVVYLESLKLAPKMGFVPLYKRAIELLMDQIRETAELLDLAVDESIPADQRRRNEDFDEARNRIYSDQSLTPRFPALARLLRGIHGNDPAAERILSGDAVKTLPFADYGLTNPIDNEYDAVRCLAAFVNLCTQGAPTLLEGQVLKEYKAFYFLIDELEMIQDFKPAEVLSINHGFRDLLNACPENCCFLFGMAGDARDIFAFLDRYVLRRMTRELIEIEPMDVDQAVQFVREALAAYRSEPNVPNEYPFRQEALKLICERTQDKTAWGLFQNCRRVLQKAVLTGKLVKDSWIEPDDAAALL